MQGPISHLVSDGDATELFRLKAQIQDCLARERDLLHLVSQQRQELARLHGLVSDLQLSNAMMPDNVCGQCRLCGEDSSDNGSLVSIGSSHPDVEAVIIGMKRLRVETR